MEIVVDAYGPEERAMGWYYYLEDRLAFPFAARCRRLEPTSPLNLNERVDVLGMAPETSCEHDMFVWIARTPRRLAVPLIQLQPHNADAVTKQAVADWHYWKAQAYEF